MKVFIFPGQGAQQRGMGKDLFPQWPEQTRIASEILGYDLQSLCLEDPRQELNKTQFSQPALFVVGALAYLRRRKQLGCDPDFAAGHSLGEYTALFAAGAFDFAVGVQLVKRRGELMAKAAGGAMAAVLNLEVARVRSLLSENQLDTLDIANLNSATQTVISGPEADIVRAARIFEAAGARYARLNTSAAFHSRYMEPAMREFAAYLDGQTFRALRLPVVANVTARPYQDAKAKELLVTQLRSPVRWSESVEYLLDQGEVEFEELGPGTVLSRIITEIRRKYTPRPVAPLDVPPAREPAPLVERGVGSAPPPEPVKPRAAAAGERPGRDLGSAEFRREYDTDYAYYAAPLGEGISGVQMLQRLAQAGILGVFGATGLPAPELDRALAELRQRLGSRPFAVDVRAGVEEDRLIQRLLHHGVQVIEASDFVLMTPALVRYRLKGVHRRSDGRVRAPNRIIGKTSRLEIGLKFLSPPPAKIVAELVSSGQLSAAEAALAGELTMATDLCVRVDPALEQASVLALLPAFLALRREQGRQATPSAAVAATVRIGLGGGIGAPEGAAAAFLLGADFICAASMNQCSVEAATSELVKDLLAQAELHDTTAAPDRWQFEVGGRTSVLKRGAFFPARANRLYELYRAHRSVDGLDPETRRLLEEKYFGRRLQQLEEELAASAPSDASPLGPKTKLARLFRAYLSQCSAWARLGDATQRVQFNIPCSAAMGATNAWLSGTPLTNWRSRHVDDLALRLMNGAADYLRRQCSRLITI